MTQRILWIHGWGMSSDVWKGMPESLSEYEHEMIDFGSCETVKSFRDVLKHAITSNDNSTADNRWNVVAWSMGGLLALDLMLTDEVASRFNKVVLIGTTLRFTAQDRHAGWPPRVLERMKKRLRNQPEETLADFKKGCFSSPERENLAHSLMALDEIKPDCSHNGLVAGLDYLLETDLRPHIQKKTRLPSMLWIHGELDQVCPVGNLHSVASWEEKGHLRKVILPGAGHAPFLTQRQQVLNLMREFFRK